MHTLCFSGGSGRWGSSIILNIGFSARTGCKTSCCLMLLLPISEWGVGGDITCLVAASSISFRTISHISSLIFFMSSDGWWKYELGLTKRSWPTTRPGWSGLPNAWPNMSFGPGGGSPVSLAFSSNSSYNKTYISNNLMKMIYISIKDNQFKVARKWIVLIQRIIDKLVYNINMFCSKRHKYANLLSC